MTERSGWPSDTSSPSDSPEFGAPQRGRPHRSRTDRKVAGVAGGVGRALGVDPVLLRVAFVVLTIFGGFGLLLYAVGWLLLPDDGERVSAAEALLGRGRSSVPQPWAVALVVIAALSVASMFSWGLPFFPLVIIGIVVVSVMRRHRGDHAGAARPWARPEQRREHARQFGYDRRAARWDAHAERHARRWADRADRWGAQASHWGEQAERWINTNPWQGQAQRGQQQQQSSSPFPRPAFWDSPDPASRVSGAVPVADAPPDAVRLTKEETSRPEAPVEGPRTPPAWDPLGAAPFAWDLPEPTPIPVAPAVRRGGGAISRVALGTALIAGGAAVGLVLAGIWTLSWAQVAAVPLVVVALGLLVAALRGRGMALAVPGLMLAVVTVALSVTGLRGTDGYGNQTWTATAATVQPAYEVQAGQGTLNLTGVSVPKGQTVATTLTVRAGQATVLLPKDATVDVHCDVAAGRAVCLDQNAAGVNEDVTSTVAGTDGGGTLEVTVNVDGGFVDVHRG